MSILDALQHSDPIQRRQAIAQLARKGAVRALPPLHNIQESDPVPNLRVLAGKAITLIEKRGTVKQDFMTTTEKRRKTPAMPSPFVEEVIQLTPAPPRPTPQPKRPSFAASIAARSGSSRQYSADPEQYEGGTRRNLLPFVLLLVTAFVLLAMGVYLMLPK